MIDKIEIKLMNYELVIKENTCCINNKSIKLNKDDMENIIRIIRNWTHEYTNNKIIGESHDYINIYEDNKKYSYVFHNNYPTDMDNLISYIGDMYAR